MNTLLASAAHPLPSSRIAPGDGLGPSSGSEGANRPAGAVPLLPPTVPETTAVRGARAPLLDEDQPVELRPEAARDAVDIAEAMMSLVRSHSHLRARLSSHQDGDLGAAILMLKLEKGGPRRASDLAAELCSDPSTVSRQVAGLVRAGLVERKADPDDGRASILVLTASGHLRAGEHRTLRGEAMAPIFGDWSAEDRATFIRLLRSYASGLDQHRDQILAGLAAVSDVSETPLSAAPPVPAAQSPKSTPAPIPPAMHPAPAERSR